MRHRLPFVSLAAILVVSLSASAADILFPAPIHLTRSVHDSIGGATIVVEQYCHGNRVVTVRGALTSIADYGKGELTEIDREARTYSVTPFDEVARALRAGQPAAELDESPTKRQTRVQIDGKVALTKDALDVLIGAAYPNSRNREADDVAAAARGRGRIAANSSEQTYALPVEQHTTYEIAGERAEIRDVVTRVGDELVPPDLVAIPPDAKLVESGLVQRMRAIEQLESAGRTR